MKVKTAIVTGAAGGIGGAVVRQLVSEGYRVAAMDVAAEEKALPAFEPFGSSIVYCKGDISCADDRQAVLESALALDSRVDLLVNVAGVSPLVRADLLEMTEESYDRVMSINTKGTLFLTQLAARQMLAQTEIDGRKGTIINISSLSAYASSCNRGEYCISKAGVSMITKLFAERLSGEGILVYEIRPGIIATNMTSVVKEKYDALIEGGLLPIARWGLPEDIAEGVSVLAEGRLSYSPGQVLNIDGGFHLRRL